MINKYNINISGKMTSFKKKKKKRKKKSSSCIDVPLSRVKA